MAGWSDLYDRSIPSIPKQVFLSVGEVSSLVWDTVNSALSGYDFYVRASKPEDLSYTMTELGANSAYLIVDPSPDLMKSLAMLLKGGATEAVFVIMSKAPAKEDDYLHVLKTKAQASKLYFTISAPKTEAAQDKMVSFFLMRWAVTRETCFKACNALDYSPGKLYQFDHLMLLSTGGQVLPSSQTQVIVDELLGTDSPNTVVGRILEGRPVESDYTEKFTEDVLNFLLSLALHAKRILGSWRTGNSTVSSASKETGLSQFLILRAWPLADTLNDEQLSRLIKVIEFGLRNVAGNPEVLATVSRAWRG